MVKEWGSFLLDDYYINFDEVYETYDEIKNKIDTAMKAGADTNIGLEYKTNISARYAEASRHTITTGWDVIDDLMDGGLGPGELGVIVAPSGIGKTWVLSALGAAAVKAGKNVLHYTLELNENYVGLRYDACFTGIDFQNIRNNVDSVRKKIADVPGKLIIKYFPIIIRYKYIYFFHIFSSIFF